jgi:hypothetical protein
MKRFHTQDNIGKAKYTVSWHDGIDKHKDGSDFFNLRIFKNKKLRDKFICELLGNNGYVERPFFTT